MSGGLDRVEIINAHKVQFITSGPFGALLATLPLAFIMPPVAGASGDYGTKGYGTGPFKVRKFNSQKGLFLESNPAPVKYAAKLLGLCNDDVRLPLVKITKETQEAVKKALFSAKLI